MFDMWSAEGLFAGDEGTFPDVTDGPGAFSSGAYDCAPGEGSVVGDLWGWAATALAGAAAYAGVRRLLDRGRRGAPTPLATGTAAPEPVPARIPSTQNDPADAPSQSEEATQKVAQLVAELVALHDLEPSDTLRRRIVRSLSKVDVLIDEESDIAFDAERHDVIGTVPAQAGVSPGTVVEVVRAGFVRADGRVVRATEVVVAADVDGAW